MQVAVDQVGISTTDDHVNQLAVRHFEDGQVWVFITSLFLIIISVKYIYLKYMGN